MTYKQQKIEPSQPGTTLVVSMDVKLFRDQAFPWWQHVPNWASATGAGEGRDIEVWIANEFIDWAHYRETGNYRPTGVSVTRQLDPEKLEQARRLAENFQVDSGAI